MTNWSKRVKSYLISAASLIGSAFTIIVFTPEWGQFVDWANTTFHNTLIGYGVPPAIIVVVGLLVAEIWKEILNHMAIKKALKSGHTMAVSRADWIDLY